MNFFENELKKIVDMGVSFAEPRYAGGACYGTLGDDLRIKLQFVVLSQPDHYDAIKATVINRSDGPIDNAVFLFHDLLGIKQADNPNYKLGVIPRIWTDKSGISTWGEYTLLPSDYELIADAVSTYCEVFQGQEMGGQGMSMGGQL